jgi:NAD(P)-dependent dehydrogenase (short-subunit alcohol dehydrogenase family)
MDLDLQDGGVLVTGGSGGMGRAIVRAYAAEGARVTLTYVADEEAASSIVKEVESGGAVRQRCRWTSLITPPSSLP